MNKTNDKAYAVGNLGFMQIDNPGNVCPGCERDIVIPWENECLESDHFAVKKIGGDIGVPLPPEDAALYTYCECGMMLVVRIKVVSIQYILERDWYDYVPSHK